MHRLRSGPDRYPSSDSALPQAETPRNSAIRRLLPELALVAATLALAVGLRAVALAH